MSAKNSVNTDTSANQSIDQIRSILFGEESEAQRERVETLDKRLQKSLREARADAASRTDGLDRQLADAKAELSNHLAEEKTSRDTDVAKLKKAIDELGKKTERSLKTFSEQLSGRIDELQEEFNAALASRTQDLQDQLNLASDQLEDRKADRVVLAELFSTMAEQLNPTDGSRKSN